MNLLIVSQYFWPENFRINDLALELMQRGHQVTVLTGQPNYPQGDFYPGYGAWWPQREDYQGIQVIRTPLVARGQKKALRLAANYASWALSGSLLGPWLCRKPYDAIFVFGLSPVTLALPAIAIKKRQGCPIAFWVQDLWPDSLSAAGATSNSKVLAQVDRLVRYIYRHCDLIMTTSPGARLRIMRQDQPGEKIRYFPQWVEGLFQPLQPSPEAPERAELPPGFKVMFAGNIGASQSFECLLEAARLLKDDPRIQWVILGDGRNKAWVEGEVERLGLGNCFHLMGSRPLDSMPTYYALADVLLVSLKRDPAFALTIPGKVQSYLACQKPVLASLDGEGARVVQEAGAGLACPAEDAPALAQAVRQLADLSPEQRAEMGQRAKAYSDAHFDRKLLIDRLEGWLLELSQAK